MKRNKFFKLEQIRHNSITKLPAGYRKMVQIFEGNKSFNIVKIELVAT
ncbi:hypothetical protein [Undibacterium sp. YM2]|nr:hypothetical protein [Undibacterium sp. YM2]